MSVKKHTRIKRLRIKEFAKLLLKLTSIQVPEHERICNQQPKVWEEISRAVGMLGKQDRKRLWLLTK